MVTGTRLDIAGVGALNVDVIVRADASFPGAGTDSETRVDDAEMRELLDEVGRLPRQVALGGSAFNTVTRISRDRPDLRLGFVGVAGRTPFEEQPFVERLKGAGIDAGAVRGVAERAGVCLAIEHAGTRALHVAPGANTSMARHLDEHHCEIVAYLSCFRTIHVTSFLDDATPEALLRVLGDLRRHAPGTRVSLDPGHEWCSRPTRVVRGLMAVADVLVFNSHEFAAVRAHRVKTGGAMVVVKAPDGVRVHTPDRKDPLHVPSSRLRPEEIRRATGAGDAFAAGFLAALTDDPEDTRFAVGAGLAVARAHLSAGPESPEAATRRE